MRELRARMEVVELGRQRDPLARDVSEPEGDELEEEASLMAKTPELRYFRLILGATSRPKPFLPMRGALLLNTSLTGLVSWTNILSMMRLRRTRRSHLQ